VPESELDAFLRFLTCFLLEWGCVFLFVLFFEVVLPASVDKISDVVSGQLSHWVRQAVSCHDDAAFLLVDRSSIRYKVRFMTCFMCIS